MAEAARAEALRRAEVGQPPATDSEHGELLPPKGLYPVRAACGKSAWAGSEGRAEVAGQRWPAASPDPTAMTMVITSHLSKGRKLQQTNRSPRHRLGRGGNAATEC